jgi:hypothetical protein
MVGIDGLLRDAESEQTLEHILIRIHNGNENIFEVLSEYLTGEDIQKIHGWMRGELKIEEQLLFRGASVYDTTGE